MQFRDSFEFLNYMVSKMADESDYKKLNLLISVSLEFGIISAQQNQYLRRRLNVNAWNCGVFAPMKYGDLSIFKELRKHDLISYADRNYF